MTASTASRESKRKDGEIIIYPMAATKIPKGCMVNIDNYGYAVNASDRLGEIFAGVAYETVDNSYGSAGDMEIRVQTTGTFVFVDGGGNGRQSDVGSSFNVVDNQTVTDALTVATIRAGIAVESIDPTQVRIRIDRFAS